MIKNIKQYITSLSSFQNVNNQLQTKLLLFADELSTSLQSDSDSFDLSIQEQLQRLSKILNTPAKVSILKDTNHRKLIISFIKQAGIEHYKYSYYNRAKISSNHIKRLEEVGPILFSEAVMIACKLNIINRNSSRNYIEDHLYTQTENAVDLRIQEVLKLCDGKKRAINNNFKKLEYILEGPDSLEVIKELGKLLRESWKKDKSSKKQVIMVEEMEEVQDTLTAVLKDQNWNVKQQASEQQDRQDRLSFSSSQEQIISKNKEYAKLSINQNFCMSQEMNQSTKDYFDNLLDYSES